MKKYLLSFLIFSTFLIQAQIKKPKPHFETFLKTSYAFIDNDTPVHLLNVEASLYINTFGNTTACEEGVNLAHCFIINVITFISAFELSGGFDTTYFDDKLYFSPKAGFYLRPFYYAKAGLTISTFGLNSSVGISFPIKNDYLIEMLFQSNMVNFKHAPFEDEGLSRFQIGLQIPFYSDLSSYKKSKNLIF